MDQIEYVNALKPIVTEEVTTSRAKALGTTSAEADKLQLASIEKGTKEADEQSRLASPKLAKLFLSLLMSLAYALQTRPDLAIFVNALQRYAQTPRLVHVKRLNAVVMWADKTSDQTDVSEK